MPDRKTRIALVTGAGRGIGAAIALRLARAGALAIVNYARSEKQASALVDAIRSQGGRAEAVRADVGSVDAVRAMFDRIESDWGPVDVLVNNAGIAQRKLSLEVTEEEYDAILDVNLKGAFFCAQRALGSMKKKGWGRVINISSIHETKPTGFCTPYSMSKGGMLMMTRELALEFGPFGITVNNVTPGAIRTDMNREALADRDYEAMIVERIPARRIGDPDEVAALVAFLASDDAAYVNGASWFVDGGLAM
ncbi:MAG TPA: 3-oxoacyl-ACP reductase family protein [Thermoguttaceae bacterium]|nr:3-oxoacyl-ACP reductase family protein [Thermoguttaceae bacterium]